MSKTLLILRHAKSDQSDSGQPDHERPLNARGKRDATRMGRLLRDEGLLPDIILTSTAKRAQQTVKRVIETSGYTGFVRELDGLYGATPSAYLAALSDVEDNFDRAMVVGHNPGLEQLVYLLTDTLKVLPTAALARIELPLDRWSDVILAPHSTFMRVWQPRDLD